MQVVQIIKNMKKILIAILLISTAGIATGYYLYNKPAKGIESVKADVTIDAPTLFSSYENDETTSNQKFLGKVVEVEGVVQNMNCLRDGNSSITLKTNNEMFGVICNLDSLHAKDVIYKEGEKAKLKGVCTGMLMDVVLIKCIPVK